MIQKEITGPLRRPCRQFGPHPFQEDRRIWQGITWRTAERHGGVPVARGTEKGGIGCLGQARQRKDR